MKILALQDSDWLTTLPRRVMPYHDEWLVSLLLRCDEANFWESGETIRLLRRWTQFSGSGLQSSLIVAPRPILDCLAQALMISRERLLATTYYTELAYLYPPIWNKPLKEPSPRLLLGHHPHRENRSGRREHDLKAVPIERWIRLCPACIAEKRYIRRTVVLPHLQYCPTHHIALQEHCPCGRSLSFFSPGRLPFTCDTCGLHWSQWPQTRPEPARLALECRLFTLYQFFLLRGTPLLRSSALRLVRHRMKETEELHLKLSGKTIKTKSLLGHFSLGFLVDVLVSVDVSPDDIVSA